LEVQLTPTRLVSDSSNDWGQGLKLVKSYIDANHVCYCWFDYSFPLVDPMASVADRVMEGYTCIALNSENQWSY